MQCSYCKIKGHSITIVAIGRARQIANRQLLLLLLILQIIILLIIIPLNLISLSIIILLTLPQHALIHLLPLLPLLLLIPAILRVIDVGRQVIDVLIAPIGSRGTPGGNRLGWKLVIV